MRRIRLSLLLTAWGLVVTGFLAWMLVAPGGYNATNTGDDLGELVAALLAGVAALLAAPRHRGRLRLAWNLLAGYCLLWAAGEAAWSWLELVQRQPNPFPSVADVGFLSAVPLGAAAIVLFPHLPRQEARLKLVLDGLLISAALLGVSWASVLGAVYQAGGDTTLDQVLSLAYPISDVVIATMLLSVASRTRPPDRLTLMLLVGGLAGIAVSDSAFAYLSATGSFDNLAPLDTGWVAGFLLIAVTAVHARAHPVGLAIPQRTTSRAQLLLPYLPAGAALVLATVEELRGHGLSLFTFTTLVVLVVLVALRQLVTLAENVRLVRALEAREVALRLQATHDPLTGLLNRTGFHERVDLAGVPPGGGYEAVLFLDLDNFKDVNDRIGHGAGDQILIAVADRLRSCLRDDDVAARFGGDEFVVALRRVEALADAETVALRVLAAIAEPAAVVEGRVVRLRASLGLAVAPCGVPGDELLRRADMAMYRSKAARDGRYAIDHELCGPAAPVSAAG